MPADTDKKIDVYQRAGGVTTLLSPARADAAAGLRRTRQRCVLRRRLARRLDRLPRVRGATDAGRHQPPQGRRPRAPAGARCGGVRAGRSGPGSRRPRVVAPAAGGAAPPKSAARLRVAARPRALRLARGKTRLAQRGRGLALRLIATRTLLVGAERIVAGRRDGATCRRPTRRLRRAPSCLRTVVGARPAAARDHGQPRRAPARAPLTEARPLSHHADAARRARASGHPVRLTLKLKR